MKMPSTTNIKVEAKPSTDVGDAAKQCLNCLEKKVRNLEKRKGRIEQNQEKASKGSKLEKEQEISLHQYEQVTHDLEFARELHKQFLSIHQEHEKMVKKQTKKEKAERQAVEIKRVSEILQLQSTLDLLGGNKVREDFKTGKHGAVVLTDDNLDQLDKLYQVISPSRDDSGDDYPQRLNAAAEHMVNILDGKDRQVLGTTYKELKELLTLINECGYFERASQASEEEVVAETTEEVEDEVTEEAEEISGDNGLASSDAGESVPDPQQQPIDLTVSANTDGAQSQMEMPPQQPLNTIEQDAFFAPSSTTAYQEESEARYSPVYRTAQQVPDFESFTNNRPFQFIQTSYVMPESQATAPSVVDPAVIHAQPAAGSGLAFMSQGGFEAPGQPQAAQPQPQTLTQQQTPAPAQPTPTVNNLTMGELSSAESLGQQQAPAQPPQPQPQQPPQSAQADFNSQAFSQASLPQSMQPEVLFNTPAGVVEEVAGSLTPHSGMMGQMREDSSSSAYEIPPSIPMPPSQSQDQSQLDQQQQQQEKKFQMNASAPVFQSMYAQVATGQAVPVSVPPPVVPAVSADIPSGPPAGDYNSAAVNSGGDYQQGYQGNNGFNSGYSRGGRGGGGFRGTRSGGAPNGNNRNGGPGPMQNGFGGRGGGPNQNNSRSGRGGTFQGYPPSANYRPDGFQGNYNTGGFNKFQNRGGMNSAGGPVSTGYPRGGPGGNGNRVGGMRGMGRGGAGAPRGGPRSGYNRPPPNQ